MTEQLQHSRCLSRTLILAPEEAHRCCCLYVEPHHLLLAMLAVRSSVVARVFGSLLPDRDVLQLARIVVGDCQFVPAIDALPNTTWTPLASRMLESATALALGRNAQYVGTEHLLEVLLLLCEDQGPTGPLAKVLQMLGLRPQDVSGRLGEMIHESTSATAT